MSEFPTTPILDTFDRADENPAVGWAPVGNPALGRLKVVSNQAAQHGWPLDVIDYWTASSFLANQEAYVTVKTRPALGERIYMFGRANTPGTSWNGYTLQVVQKSATVDKWLLAKHTNGVSGPEFASAEYPLLAAGDKVGFEFVGQTLRAYLHRTPTGDACEGGSGIQHEGEWVQILSATDGTYAGGGYIGLGTSSSAVRLDDFGGGSIVQANPLLVPQPAADPYAEPAVYADLTPQGQPYEPPTITSYNMSGGIQAVPNVGVFDTDCDYRHSSKDDPLVYPGCRDCGSHCHDFAGNSSTDGFSTGATLLARHLQDKEPGGRKPGCKDKGDGAAYWSPALYEDDIKRQPVGIHAYYRAYQTGVPIVPYPVGFGMVSKRYEWACNTERFESKGSTIPADCKQAGFVALITFPECWDGVNLYLPNSAHVKFRYPAGGEGKKAGPCPGTHPKRLAELALVIRYGTSTPGPHTYRLSSGDETTMHADFFNAWEPDKQALLIQCCLRCHRNSAWCKDDIHNLDEAGNPPFDCRC